MKLSSCGIQGSLHAFFLADDGAILHCVRDKEGTWTAWHKLHSLQFADMSCAVVGSEIHLIAVTYSGIAVHNVLSASGEWAEFQQLPNQPILKK